MAAVTMIAFVMLPAALETSGHGAGASAV